MSNLKNFYNKAKNFLKKLVNECMTNDLFALSGDMTYKLILALFPLLIFAFNVISFLNLDSSLILDSINGALPPEVMEIITTFVTEVVDVKSTTLLSASLLMSIFSASSGFASMMRGINKTYGEEDTRNWVHKRLLSMVLVLVFVLVVVLAMGMMIFSNNIRAFILRHLGENETINFLFSISGYFISIFIILVIIVIIYKVGSFKKVKIIDVFPGACVTVIFWLLFSKVFNVYVTNFSRYSVVYGSIGSIFILLIWLNFISAFLLMGSQINALLVDMPQEAGARKEK